MKHILLFLIICCNYSYAQESFVTTGETAVTDKGSVSYSIGQVFDHSFGYNPNTLIVHEGVQQPYELFIIDEEEPYSTDIPSNEIYQDDDSNFILPDFEFSVFPNPSIGVITLKTEQLDKNLLYNYTINDAQGRLITTQKIKNSQTSIDATHLTNGLFYLTITEAGIPIKSFKLLKLAK